METPTSSLSPIAAPTVLPQGRCLLCSHREQSCCLGAIPLHPTFPFKKDSLIFIATDLWTSMCICIIGGLWQLLRGGAWACSCKERKLRPSFPSLPQGHVPHTEAVCVSHLTFPTSSGFPVLLHVVCDHGDPAPDLPSRPSAQGPCPARQSLHFPPPERDSDCPAHPTEPGTEVKGPLANTWMTTLGSGVHPGPAVAK